MAIIQFIKRHGRSIGLGLLLAVTIATISTGSRLWRSSQAPVDVYVVLGGSIRREMHMAAVASTLPQPVPILVSAGSADPCIRLLFEQAGAPLQQVWLEHCAQSTFGNFVYALPLVERWGTRHVALVTSGSHTRRALTMARILWGVRGVWVHPLTVEESGIPGNRETLLKTTLDIARSLGWALVSQVYRPKCDQVVALENVDLRRWQQRGFQCEHQAGLEDS